MAPILTGELKQAVIIDNRAGAGGHIGAAAVARATPDGTTMLWSGGAILVSGITKGLHYNPMTDLIPVARLLRGSFVLLVGASSPYKTLADLISYGRAHPGKLLYASSSVGNSTHIGAGMLSSMTGLKATHVPYKGNVPALQDVAGGRVDFMIDTRTSALPMIQAGKVRPIAVTALHRTPDFPQLPAIAEVVEGYQLEGWTGFFVAAKTPPATVERLAAAVQKVSTNPGLIERMKPLGGEVAFLGPEAAHKFMLEDYARISKVVREAGITAQ
ncbi:MAG: Bug family tripartite tricarboxylate transporter substrate binding protein [Cupriavidus necator]